MAKGKNLNPADAFRKAQRKKELKKATGRAKARDFALVKKDTRELEEEVERLEANGEASAADKSRIVELRSELESINKKKEEYVAEHPEHRKLVFRSRKQQGDHETNAKEEDPAQMTRNLFNKHGLPRHPERSLYYDPVLNPYGVPPPGMPYVERPLKPEELGNDKHDESDASDDDIVMPDGPPPGAGGEDDSDDGIPMPEGPPPPKDGVRTNAAVPPPLPPTTLPVGLMPPAFPIVNTFTPPLPDSVSNLPPSPPSGFPPPFYATGAPPLPPTLPPPMALLGTLPPLPPPPPPFGFPAHLFPLPPPPGFPPPGAFQQPQMPPPPPGFFPRRSQSISAMQDPLSSIPHQTYQAHRASKLTEPNPAPPLPPVSGTIAPSEGTSGAATVEAAPQLRDFKKESTSFVPAALKRKKAGAGNVTASRINAAPSLEPTAGSVESESRAARPDLLSALKDQLGSAVGNPAVKAADLSDKSTRSKPKNDYEKFLEEMGDILGKT
ncbi:uncharacterized protein FIBRA_00089 [Fibroporia radiculosa]|uniref:Wbp11/ELF5/Saf1 N-terminal domain-containing protein n=1 Tax=Fibroporia radiculosa TaxID=599839 RepID=J7RUU7_9APHY|nr:uncharacterized protein FIBRA_00089 [Fibroporia radiculosa]CCL98095.1 predicted protein [Fibroporia radiculosa]